MYQPNSNETEKLMWLGKFERILTETYIKWSGVIIIAGDLYIDLLNGNTQSQHLYKDILNFKFYNHAPYVIFNIKKETTLQVYT